jgi:hypothetical protein
MIYILFYVFLYCNADIILNKLYLSNFTVNNELIRDNPEFYYSITNVNLFVLAVYSIYIFKNVIYYKSVNKKSNALALIYIKYTLHVFFKRKCVFEKYWIGYNIQHNANSIKLV